MGKKLSKPQIAALEKAEKGLPLHYGLKSRSEFGGLSGTIEFLQRHRLITPDDITERGREVLRAGRLPDD